MNSFYWQFGKVLTTSLVVFICGSIVFKNFWNAKSAFSTFLFVDSFQLWLQILRGYDWGILCDMVWRLFEKLCYMRHMRVRILGYFWLLEACQESCRKLWRGKSLRRPWTYFFVLVQGGFSQTFVHFTVTGLCWAETCLLPVQTRFRAMSQVPKGKYVAFFITWGVQVESAHCMKCWLNLLCLVSPPPSDQLMWQGCKLSTCLLSSTVEFCLKLVKAGFIVWLPSWVLWKRIQGHQWRIRGKLPFWDSCALSHGLQNMLHF